MDFQVFHRYRTLSHRGLAPLLNCSHCGNEQALVLGPEEEPALRCYFCNVLTLPGLGMYNRLNAIVKEHYID